MKRFVPILILVLLNSALCIAQQQSPKDDSKQKAKTAQAEKAATRFLRRYSETKNFAVVYREFFVQDKSLRLQAAASYVDWVTDKNLIDKFGEAVLEQFYVSFLDMWYLTYFYTLNRKDYGSDKEKAALMSLWFSLISQWITKLNITDDEELNVAMLPLLSYLNCDNRKDDSQITKEQFKNYIALLNLFSDKVRSRIPANPAFTKRYKQNVKDIIWNDRPTYILDGEDYFGIPKDRKVYHISRGIFRLVWIEENGRFKIVAPILSD